MTMNSMERNHLFANREHEMEFLFDLLDQAIGGKPRAVLIKGEAGSGKTYLVNEFLSRVQKEHPEYVVATGTCSEIGHLTEPLLPFREMMLAIASQARSGRRHDLLIGIADFLNQVAPDWLEAIPGIGQLLKAMYTTISVAVKSGQKPGLEQRLHQQFERAISKACGQRASLLFLDDFQWIDPSSVALFLYLVQRMQPSKSLSSLPMLMLTAYRPMDIELAQNKHSLQSALYEAQRYGAEVIDLDKCLDRDKEYLTYLVSDYIDKRYERHKINGDFIEWLVTLTTGNCLMLDLLLTDLEHREVLVAKDGIWYAYGYTSDLEIPTTLSSMIERKLQFVEDPTAMALIEAASVQGKQFSIEVIAHTLGAEELVEISMSIQKLQKAGVIQPTDHQSLLRERFVTYTFRHDLLREYVDKRLSSSPLRKKELHARIGASLEELNYPVSSGDLARHFHLGGLYDKSIDHYLESAQHLLSIESLEQLETTVKNALLAVSHIADEKKRATAESRLLWYLSYVWDAKGEWQLGIERIQVAYQKLRENLTVASSLAARLGHLYMRGGRDYDEAEKWLTRALESMKDGEKELMELAAITDLANVLRATGQFDRAIDVAESHIERYEDWANLDYPFLYHLSVLFWHLGFICEQKSGYDLHSPDFERALDYYGRSIDISDRLEASSLRGRSLAHNSYLLALKGYPDLAEKQAREAVEIFADEIDPRIKAIAIRQLGAVLLTSEKLEEAHRELGEALALQRSISDMPGIAHTLIFMASLMRRKGHIEEGKKLSAEAWQIITDHKHDALVTLFKFMDLPLPPDDRSESGEVSPQ